MTAACQLLILDKVLLIVSGYLLNSLCWLTNPHLPSWQSLLPVKESPNVFLPERRVLHGIGVACWLLLLSVSHCHPTCQSPCSLMTEDCGSRGRIVGCLPRSQPLSLEDPALSLSTDAPELFPVSWSRALFSLGLVTQAGVRFVNERGPTGELRELLGKPVFSLITVLCFPEQTTTLSQGVTWEHRTRGLRNLHTSVESDSLWPYGPQCTRLLCPWSFPGKNTGL